MLVLWILAAVCAVGDWWLVATRERPNEPSTRLRWLTKPGVMVALIAIVALADGIDDRTKVWLLVALVLSLGGDVFLLMDDKWFIAGLATFLAGHVAFVVAFVGINSESSPWAALVLMAMPFGYVIVLAARQHDKVLGGAVIAYLVVISAMYVAAAGTREPWILAGGALFVASDTMLGWNRFVAHRRPLPIGVITTYHLAQACFTAWAATR